MTCMITINCEYNFELVVTSMFISPSAFTKFVSLIPRSFAKEMYWQAHTHNNHKIGLTHCQLEIAYILQNKEGKSTTVERNSEQKMKLVKQSEIGSIMVNI